MSTNQTLKNQKLELAKLIYFAAHYRLFINFFRQSEIEARRNSAIEAEAITHETVDADMLALGFVYDLTDHIWHETEIEWSNEETHHDYR